MKNINAILWIGWLCEKIEKVIKTENTLSSYITVANTTKAQLSDTASSYYIL